MRERRPAEDDATLALRALAHIAGDYDLGPRLLEMTGMDAASLRARAGEPAVLAAVLNFLTAHEPSLIEVAEALDVPPQRLADAAMRLDT
ncbi:DUF3572 family protein [Glacieibacterium frigidum]|uniref:DUF3572 family protein n=1 Tax=Glacieibacterium frigidum TaxID=2593303 RepID=A0A552UJB2_9SPHN|nr:DUF3572 family protein [Glacieibacterium frigidum]